MANYQHLPVTDRPLAVSGLLSYRCKGAFDWIMIGAKDDEDAMVQARRSSAHAKRETLQKWDGEAYAPCVDRTEGFREVASSDQALETASASPAP
jgi:hypothetical protein